MGNGKIQYGLKEEREVISHNIFIQRESESNMKSIPHAQTDEANISKTIMKLCLK